MLRLLSLYLLLSSFQKIETIIMRDVNRFLSDMKANTNTDLAAKWTKVEELYNKKLWHQLTTEIQTIIKEPSMQESLIQIYQEFIADFETRLDPLSLAFIAIPILERFTNPEEAIAFVEKIGEKVKMNNEAYAMTKVLIGRVKLHKYEQHKETKVMNQTTLYDNSEGFK